MAPRVTPLMLLVRGATTSGRHATCCGVLLAELHDLHVRHRGWDSERYGRSVAKQYVTALLSR